MERRYMDLYVQSVSSVDECAVCNCTYQRAGELYD